MIDERTMTFKGQEIPVLIGSHTWSRIGEKCAGYSSIIVISDYTVGKLFKESFESQFNHKSLYWCLVSPGEESKSLEVATRLWRELVSLGADRRSCVIGLGGGVVLDLAGFIAATFMRGVDFVSLPTTLLAAVDAGLGGKVGVDLPEGKNLVGAFWPPRYVGTEVASLKDLPDTQWSIGMAEVIKHAVIDGGQHFEWLQNRQFSWDSRQDPDKISLLVQKSSRVKLDLVRQDPEEKNVRAYLNLGHTFAHAIESCLDYSGISHGEAVAIGMVGSVRLSRELGLLEVDFEEDLISLLSYWNLPTALEQSIPWDQAVARFDRDKKTKNNRWYFVLPRRPGGIEVIPGVDREAVKKVWSSLCQPVS